ncbi:MAG: TatD family hydrolase [Clostridia bacterium]|nr:TatD family hydrolase [Clostridia bacterium]MDY5555836.1 TatD family hydrolase [Blautia sp.]
MIVDTHAHYDDEVFDPDREKLLGSMQENGIEKIVNVCASVDGLNDTVKLMEEYSFIYGAVGVHPDDAGKMTQETLDEIRRLSCLDKMVAIGEIGLDYYWHKEDEEHKIQQEMFRAQMDIAREQKLPFMIHSRDAAQDTMDIVKKYMNKGMYGGIIHCFSYSREIAREYLNMGLYLGIGGVVTFKNAKKLKETVLYAPLSQLVLETDCPYMSPEPNRGKRNSSLNLPFVAKAIAEIKGITPEEVISATRENTKRLLGI